MQKSISVYGILLVVFSLYLSKSVNARVPANLAGTDLFPDTMTYVKISKRPKNPPKPLQASEVEESKETELAEPEPQATPSQKPKKDKRIGKPKVELEEVSQTITLPTLALNLSIGAEFFTVLAQPLWKYGNLSRLVNTTKADQNVQTTPQQIRILESYKEITQKEPLPLTEYNPVALLLRMFFWQNPGTQTLGDFRIPKTCCKVDPRTQDILLSDTLESWADGIVALMKIYEFLQSTKELAAKVQQNVVQDLTIRYFKASGIISGHPLIQGWATCPIAFTNDERKPAFSDLLIRSIVWSEENGFGYDLPLRVFQGAVYALAGHDQKAIFHFYQSLKNRLGQTIGELMPQLADIIVPDEEHLPTPFIETEDTSAPETSLAFTASTKIELFPLTYGRAIVDETSFADCFETALRNIVLALIMDEKRCFQIHLVAEKFKTFFTSYDTLAKQATAQARNDWGKLVSRLPGVLYAQPAGYDLKSSLINLLLLLNHIFELEIEPFSTLIVSTTPENQKQNHELIISTLPIINKKLAAKLGYTTDKIIAVDALENIDDVKAFSQISEIDNWEKPGLKIRCHLNSKFAVFDFWIIVMLHAEITHVNFLYSKTSAPVLHFSEKLPYLTYSKETHAPITNPLTGLVVLQTLAPSTWQNILSETIMLAKKNPAFARMLYAACAEYYDHDILLFFELLKPLADNHLCINEISAAAQTGLKSHKEDERIAAQNLLNTLAHLGEGTS